MPLKTHGRLRVRLIEFAQPAPLLLGLLPTSPESRSKLKSLERTQQLWPATHGQCTHAVTPQPAAFGPHQTADGSKAPGLLRL